MSKHPHIHLVEYSFLEVPTIDFILRPLKAMDMMDVSFIFF
jgi:Ca2+-dependent lipid-binding protein